MEVTRYHAHITIPNGEITGNISGWKITNIVLENKDSESVDHMITRYFVLGHRGFETEEDIIEYLKYFSESLGAIRYKLEQDNNFYKPITVENYMEIHVRVRTAISAPVGQYEGWVRSKNPKDASEFHKEFFYNKRMYSGNHNDVDLVLSSFTESLSGFEEVIDYHIEQIVIDSNLNHDKGWTDVSHT